MAHTAHIALLARSLARMRRRRLVEVRAAEAGIVATPWQAAVDRFSARTPVGSALRTAEWADVPVALRERAMFSAGITSASLVGEMRQRILDGLTQARQGGTGMDRSRFVAEMRQLLGAEAGDSGQLTDITSFRRLELIYDFQAQSAHGAAAHQASLDSNLLDAFPAQRLVRVESRRMPRDWYSRWAQAGEMVGWEGASRTTMVALITSPIWTALSRFDRPYPPFDFGSGMGLETVDRDEAEKLGLLPKDEPPAERLQRLREASAQARQTWDEEQQASVRDLRPETLDSLELQFGDQIAIDRTTGTAGWVRQQPYTDWAAQQLASAKTWEPREEMPPLMEAEQAREAMRDGVQVPAPGGATVTFDRSTLDHWAGYADAERRPTFLPAAIRTIESPVELWKQARQDVYISTFARPRGPYRGVVVFVDLDGHARTYFVQDLAALDAARKGVRRVFP